MLTFIGTGSAFNTKLGNNSAFLLSENGKRLLLIDCGSSIFERIIKYQLLNGIEDIQVLITHTHPDHVGSLGDLIFYSYYSMQPMFKPKVTVIYPFEIHDNVEGILKMMGLNRNLYNSISIDDYAVQGDVNIYPVRVEHVEELDCFGYLLLVKDKMIYYSGDSNMIPGRILEMFKDGRIDYFYQDTCKADYEGNVHLSLNKLCEMIPVEYRHKVYIMHQDSTFDEDEARSFGFNVV